jgi:hypothetical protein
MALPGLTCNLGATDVPLVMELNPSPARRAERERQIREAWETQQRLKAEFLAHEAERRAA